MYNCGQQQNEKQPLTFENNDELATRVSTQLPAHVSHYFCQKLCEKEYMKSQVCSYIHLTYQRW